MHLLPTFTSFVAMALEVEALVAEAAADADASSRRARAKQRRAPPRGGSGGGWVAEEGSSGGGGGARGSGAGEADEAEDARADEAEDEAAAAAAGSVRTGAAARTPTYQGPDSGCRRRPRPLLNLSPANPTHPPRRGGLCLFGADGAPLQLPRAPGRGGRQVRGPPAAGELRPLR
jgi:hypothetical protein